MGTYKSEDEFQIDQDNDDDMSCSSPASSVHSFRENRMNNEHGKVLPFDFVTARKCKTFFGEDVLEMYRGMQDAIY